MRFLALTFVRPHHVADAEWAHIDLDAATATIPFEQLKMRASRKEAKPHVVPLSRQAVALLRQLQALSGSSRWVFPSRGGHIARATLNRTLVALGYAGFHCAHGFRSSASTMLKQKRTAKAGACSTVH